MSKPGLLKACSTGLRPSSRSRGEDQVDAAALDLLGLLGVHRRGRGQVALRASRRGSTSAAVTMRGGLVDMSCCWSSSSRRLRRRTSSSTALRLRLSDDSLGFSPACSFSDAIGGVEEEAVALAFEALGDQVAGLAQFGERVAAGPRRGIRATGWR